jgi:peptidoglycan/xylan/chitin deacetylase (PgdA/CDA1 family)
MSILCYHAVEPGWDSLLSVTPERFQAHCGWLARHRLVVSLEEAVLEMRPNGRLKRNLTALTFDDGFASVYDHALHSLTAHRLPATVFLVAATLTSGGHAVDWIPGGSGGVRLKTLSRAQILEMQESGVTFGSHSYVHKDLTTLSEKDCERDLRASREVLEELLGRPVYFLAYPYGRNNEAVRRIADQVGYTHAFTMSRGGRRVGRLTIPRVGIYARNGLPTLWAKAFWYLSLKRSSISRLIAPARGGRQDRKVGGA